MSRTSSISTVFHPYKCLALFCLLLSNLVLQQVSASTPAPSPAPVLVPASTATTKIDRKIVVIPVNEFTQLLNEKEIAYGDVLKVAEQLTTPYTDKNKFLVRNDGTDLVFYLPQDMTPEQFIQSEKIAIKNAADAIATSKLISSTEKIQKERTDFITKATKIPFDTQLISLDTATSLFKNYEFKDNKLVQNIDASQLELPLDKFATKTFLYSASTLENIVKTAVAAANKPTQINYDLAEAQKEHEKAKASELEAKTKLDNMTAKFERLNATERKKKSWYPFGTWGFGTSPEDAMTEANRKYQSAQSILNYAQKCLERMKAVASADSIKNYFIWCVFQNFSANKKNKYTVQEVIDKLNEYNIDTSIKIVKDLSTTNTAATAAPLKFIQWTNKKFVRLVQANGYMNIVKLSNAADLTKCIDLLTKSVVGKEEECMEKILAILLDASTFATNSTDFITNSFSEKKLSKDAVDVAISSIRNPLIFSNEDIVKNLAAIFDPERTNVQFIDMPTLSKDTTPVMMVSSYVDFWTSKTSLLGLEKAKAIKTFFKEFASVESFTDYEVKLAAEKVEEDEKSKVKKDKKKEEIPTVDEANTSAEEGTSKKTILFIVGCVLLALAVVISLFYWALKKKKSSADADAEKQEEEKKTEV